MLKPQDCIILIKLLANPKTQWSQRKLANTLSISLSETNAGIKRLFDAGLLRRDNEDQLVPILNAAEEFLIHSIKYFFPAALGEYTRGIRTGIGAPIFKDKIATGDDPLPVWPDALGEEKGVALPPLYASVPKALRQDPDKKFYELLVLIDVIRLGRPRERNMAIQLLKERIRND